MENIGLDLPELNSDITRAAKIEGPIPVLSLIYIITRLVPHGETCSQKDHDGDTSMLSKVVSFFKSSLERPVLSP